MMTSNTDEEKHDASVDTKLAAGWQCTTHRTTGNGKLVAMFEHETMSVTIRPWKTYDQPGFPNAHRVLSLRDDKREVLAVGHEVETICDTETVALTAMEATQ
jgi:hypothetical protein